jgi:hypothetical protein
MPSQALRLLGRKALEAAVLERDSRPVGDRLEANR